MQPFWFIAGLVATGLGIAGIALPLLPATPFFLVAAFSFARSSPRLHRRLLDHPAIGPAIVNWQRDGAIRPRAKRLAMLALAATFVVSLLGGLTGWLLALQGIVLMAVAAFILTRPDGRARDTGKE